MHQEDGKSLTLPVGANGPWNLYASYALRVPRATLKETRELQRIATRLYRGPSNNAYLLAAEDNGPPASDRSTRRRVDD